MITACTTPGAPFYALDLRILGAIESAGIDAPCGILSAGIALSMGTGIAVAVVLIYSARRLYLEAVRVRRVRDRLRHISNTMRKESF